MIQGLVHSTIVEMAAIEHMYPLCEIFFHVFEISLPKEIKLLKLPTNPC